MARVPAIAVRVWRSSLSLSRRAAVAATTGLCYHRRHHHPVSLRRFSSGRLGNHDLGGALDELEAGGFYPDAGADDPPPHVWELRTHALLGLMVGKKRITVDELRRGSKPDAAATWMCSGTLVGCMAAPSRASRTTHQCHPNLLACLRRVVSNFTLTCFFLFDDIFVTRMHNCYRRY